MTIWKSGRVRTARKRWRVVCAVFDVIAIFLPMMALSSVDLPAFGRPTSVTKPLLKPSSNGTGRSSLPVGRSKRCSDHLVQRKAGVLVLVLVLVLVFFVKQSDTSSSRSSYSSSLSWTSATSISGKESSSSAVSIRRPCDKVASWRSNVSVIFSFLPSGTKRYRTHRFVRDW